MMLQRQGNTGSSIHTTNARKKFGEYGPEKRQTIRSLDVKEDVFKELMIAWEKWKKEVYSVNSDHAYDAAAKYLTGINLPADKLQQFIDLLAFSQDNGDFKLLAGIFLSALINQGTDNDYSLCLSHTETDLVFLGYRNIKHIRIEGNVGFGLGVAMERGSITVIGSARSLITSLIPVDSNSGMVDGEISIYGNMVGTIGRMKGGIVSVFGDLIWPSTLRGHKIKTLWMHGGEVHIHGKLEETEDPDFGSWIKGGKVFHQGQLIVDM